MPRRNPRRSISPELARHFRGVPIAASWFMLLLVLGLTGCIGPLAAQAQAPPELGEMGKPLEYDGVALTVSSADRTQQLGSEQRLEQISQPISAGEGNIFLVVNVTVENKTPYRLLYRTDQFTVHDGRGTAYSPSVTAGARPLGRGELDPTKDASGVINFVVPADAKDFILGFRPANRNYSLAVRLGV